MYRKYSHLLNNNAQQDVTDFLNGGPSLGALREVIHNWQVLCVQAGANTSHP